MEGESGRDPPIALLSWRREVHSSADSSLRGREEARAREGVFLYMIKRGLDPRASTFMEPYPAAVMLHSFRLRIDLKQDTEIDKIQECDDERGNQHSEEEMLEDAANTRVRANRYTADGTLDIVYRLVRAALWHVPEDCSQRARTYACHVMRRYAHVLLQAFANWYSCKELKTEVELADFWQAACLHAIYRNLCFLQRRKAEAMKEMQAAARAMREDLLSSVKFESPGVSSESCSDSEPCDSDSEPCDSYSGSDPDSGTSSESDFEVDWDYDEEQTLFDNTRLFLKTNGHADPDRSLRHPPSYPGKLGQQREIALRGQSVAYAQMRFIAALGHGPGHDAMISLSRPTEQHSHQGHKRPHPKEEEEEEEEEEDRRRYRRCSRSYGSALNIACAGGEDNAADSLSERKD